MFVWINSGFRALLTERAGSALGGSVIMPAVAALVVLPVSTLLEGYGRSSPQSDCSSWLARRSSVE